MYTAYEVSPTREKCGSRKKLEDLTCSGGEEPTIFVCAAPPVKAIRRALQILEP
jgi:hypothetical protein